MNDKVTKAMAEVEAKAKVFTEANNGKTSEEILAQMRGEEPASDDFKAFEQQYMQENESEIVSVYDRHAGLVDGAAWQKQKDFEDLLKSDNSNFIKCYEKGKEDIMKQMMKDAVSRVVHIGEDMCPFIRRNELAYDIKTQVPDIKEGDRVKVIIIKED